MPWTVAVSMSKAGLLERFRETPNAVLFATSSFWQGVDVQGEQLSCVIIDKLPFAVPTDPIVAAAIASAQKDEARALENYKAAVRLYEKGAFTEAKKQFTLALSENPSLASARKGLIASEALVRISEASIVKRDPVDTLKEIAAGVSRKSGTIGIEVSNGNGATHMARDIAEYLRAKGFKVVRLTNADNFNHAEGSIVYEKEHEELAGRIAGAIPQITDVSRPASSIGPT